MVATAVIVTAWRDGGNGGSGGSGGAVGATGTVAVVSSAITGSTSGAGASADLAARRPQTASAGVPATGVGSPLVLQ